MHNEKHTHPSIVGKSAQIKNAKTKLVEGEPTIFEILNLASLYLPDQTIETEEIIDKSYDNGIMSPHKTVIKSIGSLLVTDGNLVEISLIDRERFFVDDDLDIEHTELKSSHFNIPSGVGISRILTVAPIGYEIDIHDFESTQSAINKGLLLDVSSAFIGLSFHKNNLKAITNTLLSLSNEPHFVDRNYYRNNYTKHVNPN